MIVLEHVSKKYKGITITKDSGIALWVKNIANLTGNKATELMAVKDVSFSIDKGEIFGIYGVVKNCELPSDRFHPHIHRGYGYIEYELPDDAEKVGEFREIKHFARTMN